MNEKILAKALYKGIHEFLAEIRNCASDEDVIGKLIEDYLEILNPAQKAMVKTLLRMPWDEVVGMLYESLLEFGKRGTGYKSTKETLIEILKGYVK